MSKNLGFVVVFFSTGLITGPMLAKFLMKSTGRTSAPVLVSIAFVILLILYVIVMPESLSESTKQDAEREAAERKTEGGESALAKAKHFFKNIFDPVLFLLPGRTEISDDVKAPPSRYTLLMVLIGNGVLQIATDVVKNVFIPYMVRNIKEQAFKVYHPARWAVPPNVFSLLDCSFPDVDRISSLVGQPW